MSLKDIRSECSDVAALLQPYVDAELADDERERVAEHLQDCDPCRAAVSEQLWVQATLRVLDPEQAPASLRNKVLARLDEVDVREQERQPGLWTRIASRGRDFMRGGLVMVPAAAVAGVLFLVARGGLEPATQLSPSGIGTALSSAKLAAPPATPEQSEVGSEIADLEPDVDFPIQIVRPRAELGHDEDVQLVGARLDDADSAVRPGARLRYRVFAPGADDEHHVIDRQRAAGGPAPAGSPITFKGRQYLLVRTPSGEPVLHFERSGVAHMLRLEPGGLAPGASKDDFSILLDVAHRLADN